MADIKKEIVTAWRLYNRWRKLSTYCPALKKRVRFSLQGWYHITGEKGPKKRTLRDAYRRLKLLPHARAIILKSSTFQDIQKRGETTYYALEAVVLVSQNEATEHRRVKVVLKQDRLGNVIFYSVMDRKKKRRNVSPVSR